MAIGLGRLFGFHFPENFNHPYISQSVTEFWRRWHMTLGSFFRDYVYIPLGGNRRYQYRNILIVWMLTGLWHGASWNFVLWGLYFAVILVMEKTFLLKALQEVPKALAYSLLFFIVMFGFNFFTLVDFSRNLRGFEGNVRIWVAWAFTFSDYLALVYFQLYCPFVCHMRNLWQYPPRTSLLNRLASAIRHPGFTTAGAAVLLEPC